MVSSYVTLLVLLLGSAAAWHNGSQHTQVLPTPTPHWDFQFAIMHQHTARQNGAIINIKAKYRYYNGSDLSATFDYVPLKTLFMSYIQPTPAVPEGTYWEEVARLMGVDAWEHYPIEGLSLRLEVKGMSSPSPPANPLGIQGHRVAVVTFGNIEPWNENIDFQSCNGMDLNGACNLDLWPNPNAILDSATHNDTTPNWAEITIFVVVLLLLLLGIIILIMLAKVLAALKAATPVRPNYPAGFPAPSPTPF